MNYISISALVLLLSCTVGSNSLTGQTKSDNIKDFEALAEGQEGNISMSAYPLVKRSEIKIPVSVKGKRYDLVKDFHASNDQFEDVSSKMKHAIDEINAKGGGTLYIPVGNYAVCNVELKSNVHLLISSQAVLKGYSQGANGKSYSLFNIGKESYCENVSIQSDGGKYKVLIPEDPNGVRFVSLTNAKRFLIADAEFYDHKTKFSCIIFGPTDKTVQNVKNHFIGPTDGVIMDCELHGGDYGYGVIQAQAAQNVRFYNLYGEGGATLRLETGAKQMNDNQWGGVFDITGKNIMSVRGNAAVMASPHAMHCGIINLSDITAVSSGFAARIDNGFISNKYVKRADITVGDFEGGSLKNVTCFYGTKGQLKVKHLGHLPSELIPLVAEPDAATVCEPAPSACAVLFEPNYPFDFDHSTVDAIGFNYSEAVLSKPHPLTSEAKAIVKLANQKRDIAQKEAKILLKKKAMRRKKLNKKKNKKNRI